LSRKQFEPFVKWCNDDLTITERARGYLQGLPAVTVGAEVTTSAGGTYTASEQAMLNELKTLVNQLRAVLVTNGIVE
jgi:hypothetical protein